MGEEGEAEEEGEGKGEEEEEKEEEEKEERKTKLQEASKSLVQMRCTQLISSPTGWHCSTTDISL